MNVMARVLKTPRTSSGEGYVRVGRGGQEKPVQKKEAGKNPRKELGTTKKKKRWGLNGPVETSPPSGPKISKNSPTTQSRKTNKYRATFGGGLKTGWCKELRGPRVGS